MDLTFTEKDNFLTVTYNADPFEWKAYTENMTPDSAWEVWSKNNEEDVFEAVRKKYHYMIFDYICGKTATLTEGSISYKFAILPRAVLGKYKRIHYADFEGKENQDGAFLKAIIDCCDVTIPDHLLNYEIDRAISDLSSLLQSERNTLANYLKVTGKTMKDVRDDFRDDCRRKLKTDSVVNTLVSELDIQVTDEDVNDQLRRMAIQYNMRYDELYLNSKDMRPGIEEKLRFKKLMDVLKLN